MKRNKKIIIVIFAVVICAMVAVGTLLYIKHTDKQQFIEARQAQDTIVAALPEATSVTRNDYCEHPMQKWESQGTVCNITTELSVDLGGGNVDQLVERINIVGQRNNWVYRGSNIDLLRTISKDYIQGDLYKNNNLSVMVSYKTISDGGRAGVSIDISSSGQAKFDHYKVVKQQ